jgi:hypothetical protein
MSAFCAPLALLDYLHYLVAVTMDTYETVRNYIKEQTAKNGGAVYLNVCCSRDKDDPAYQDHQCVATDSKQQLTRTLNHAKLRELLDFPPADVAARVCVGGRYFAQLSLSQSDL